MKRREFLAATGQIAVFTAVPRLANADERQPATAPATGPLRVHRRNPRSFSDANGRAILLAGSHMWNNLVDMWRGKPPEPFDFAAYLDFLERYGHNFIRLWTWNSPGKWMAERCAIHGAVRQ